MINLKWTRLSGYRRYTRTPNGMHVVIGKDSGSMGLHTYYYIEIDDEIVMHGFVTLKDAKQYLIGNFDLGLD